METIIGYIRKLWEYVSRLFKWLQDAYDYAVDFVMNLPAFIFSKIADAVVAFFNWIPVPSFVRGAAGAFAGIPESVVFFAQPFRIGEGIAIVLLAYVLRFVIRRIPFIG